MKITLENIEPSLNPSTEELAKIILTRIGLEPRKKGSTENMHKTLIELYERVKAANREKKPEFAIMTVEEMGMYAGITRQTMYEYLKRWLHLNFIVKTSYISRRGVIYPCSAVGVDTIGNRRQLASMGVPKDNQPCPVFYMIADRFVKFSEVAAYFYIFF